MTDFELMGAALDEARKAAALGEVPVGAVVAKDGEIVAAAHNTRETYNGKTPKAGKKEKSKKTEPKPAPKPADEKQLTFGDFGTEEAAG